MQATETEIEPAIAAKNAGQALAEGAVDVRVTGCIDAAIEECARTLQEFTTEDVKPLVKVTPKKWLCLGSALKRAAKRGLCVKTGQYKDSHNRDCHGRPQMVWRSQIYGR